VGAIYRDRSGESLVVLNIIRNEALLEYANGCVRAVDARDWQLLYPQPAAF
jgi:hypothetical protein